MMQVSAADMREFAKYDHDQSSFLDMAEFIAALKADRFNKQVSDEEAMEIFKMADIDGDGKISMNEFHTMKSLNRSTGRREHLSLSHSPPLPLGPRTPLDRQPVGFPPTPRSNIFTRILVRRIK